MVFYLGEVSLRADDCEFKPKLCVQMSEVAKELKPIKNNLADLYKRLAELESKRAPASLKKAKQNKAWKEKLAAAKRKIDLKTTEVDRRIKLMSMEALSDQKHAERIATLKLAQDEVLEATAELDKLLPTGLATN